ncbi:MAG: alpha/beta hydrolase-fold protein [Chloroflexota bacterium]|nr:alpha/beta hydrolase-fold protein [Chloroflexota bacterium]
MNREHHRWYSPSLNRDMQLLVFGHAGARVLIFPTSKGRFYEWEDRGMMYGALREPLERGWLQAFCVDAIDEESWYAWWSHPGGRAYRHNQYFEYLHKEVLPFMRWKNPTNYTIAMGASFGAFHAAGFGLRYPFEINRILGICGIYDIRGFTGGYSDENVYFNNPSQFIPNEWDNGRLEAMRRQDIIITAGSGDPQVQWSRDFAALLWSKGIGNAYREWNGWVHDWPFWSQMVPRYIGGHD